MVYNGASCGLHTSLFASSFWLPTSKTLTRLLSFGCRLGYWRNVPQLPSSYLPTTLLWGGLNSVQAPSRSNSATGTPCKQEIVRYWVKTMVWSEEGSWGTFLQYQSLQIYIQKKEVWSRFLTWVTRNLRQIVMCLVHKKPRYTPP